MKRTKGFTLIELLVVISIIAILMSILTPALRKAKELAMSIFCKNNLHQYNLGMGMFLNEEDDTYPSPWYSLNLFEPGDPGRTGGCQWHDSVHNLDDYPDFRGPLYEYLGGGKVHQCPYFLRAAKTVDWKHPLNAGASWVCDDLGKEIQYSYSMNSKLGYVGGSSQEFGVLKRTQVRRSPSNVFLYAEENPWLSQPMDPAAPSKYIPYDYDAVYSEYVLNDNALLVKNTPGDTVSDCFASFHSAPSGDYSKGVSNVLFVDGHVQYATPADSYRYYKPK